MRATVSDGNLGTAVRGSIGLVWTYEDIDSYDIGAYGND